MKISVITPTIRANGLKLVKQALAYQDFKDWEWVICSPERLRSEVYEALGNFPFKFIGNPPLKKWQVWDLNYSYNRLIEHAKGELIVSWQDYTFADPDLLSVLYKHYLDDPKSVVSVCGNKYPDDDFDIPAWIDPRYGMERYSWQEIEANLCSWPKDAVYKVGGFDEKLDSHFGLDAYSLNNRISDIGGFRFFLEKSTKTYSLFHGRDKNWDKNNAMNGFYDDRKKQLISGGVWPKLNYLRG